MLTVEELKKRLPLDELRQGREDEIAYRLIKWCRKNLTEQELKDIGLKC